MLVFSTSKQGRATLNFCVICLSFHTKPMKVKENPVDEAERKSHTSKLHACQHCSATFCSPYHLRRHQYTHTGQLTELEGTKSDFKANKHFVFT